MLYLEISTLFECPCPAGTLEGGGRWPLRGKLKAIALDSALHLMRKACREAEAGRQGLPAVGRSDSAEIYGAP